MDARVALVSDAPLDESLRRALLSAFRDRGIHQCDHTDEIKDHEAYVFVCATASTVSAATVFDSAELQQESQSITNLLLWIRRFFADGRRSEVSVIIICGSSNLAAGLPRGLFSSFKTRNSRINAVETHDSKNADSIARTVQYLASWSAHEISGHSLHADHDTSNVLNKMQLSLRQPKKGPPIKVLIGIDFDSVSALLGTGKSPKNVLSDYTAGLFAAQVGVPRLLKLMKRFGVADKITWFIPGHSLESFTEQTKAIVDSGAEIGIHGYCHEAAWQLTEQQERDVLLHCMALIEKASGKKPRGYRAPLYALRETTLALLEQQGFLYDSSLTQRDNRMYRLPSPQPQPQIVAPEYRADQPASEWMHPLPRAITHPDKLTRIVEVPGNWYAEDETPLMYFPHAAGTQGYIDSELVLRNWKRKFDWTRREAFDEFEHDECHDGGGDERRDKGPWVFPLILHPDASGMAHIIPMIEELLAWLKDMGPREAVFEQISVAVEEFNSCA